LIHNLLSGVAFEKVHARAWRCAVFEIQDVCTLLDEGNLLGTNLIIHLSLSVYWPILAMTHLVAL
jgi:hypothetical protein